MFPYSSGFFEQMELVISLSKENFYLYVFFFFILIYQGIAEGTVIDYNQCFLCLEIVAKYDSMNATNSIFFSSPCKNSIIQRINWTTEPYNTVFGYDITLLCLP